MPRALSLQYGGSSRLPDQISFVERPTKPQKVFVGQIIEAPLLRRIVSIPFFCDTGVLLGIYGDYSSRVCGLRCLLALKVVKRLISDFGSVSLLVVALFLLVPIQSLTASSRCRVPLDHLCLVISGHARYLAPRRLDCEFPFGELVVRVYYVLLGLAVLFRVAVPTFHFGGHCGL